jgi:hypothetical protein
MVDPAESPTRLVPLPRTKRTLAAALLAGAGVVGLAGTNPGPTDFEEYAGERLSEWLTEELCRTDGLPMMARLLIRDCPQLVASQKPVLGRLALHHTRRRNLGLFSVYRTEMGGQELLPNWRLPRYTATTLAAAGRFLILRGSEEEAGEQGSEHGSATP